MKTIGTIGEIVVEIMALDPGYGFREALRLSGPYPSGAPAIFIDQVARLGQPCAMASRIGDDDFGRLTLERLKRDGVDVAAIGVDAEAVTGMAFVRYRPDRNRDFLFHIRDSACGRFVADAAVERMIDGCDHIHVMGSSLFAPGIVAATELAIGRVKRRGGTLSFDPNIRKEILDAPGMRAALERILRQSDVFLPSGPELFLFAPEQDASPDERAAALDVMRHGPRCVVVKHGPAGARCHTPEAVLEQPAFPAVERDPTGAGDCFGAAFVTAWLRDLPLERCLALAAACGARAVERQGPMEGTSTMAELEAAIA